MQIKYTSNIFFPKPTQPYTTPDRKPSILRIKLKEVTILDQEKIQEVALMRYSAIVPLITGLQDDYSSLADFFRDVSKKGVMAPDGTIKHYAPATMKKWYQNYKQDGFNSLLPTGRSDIGKPRKIDDELQEQIRYLKNNYPRMSAAAIFRQLHDSGSIVSEELSESSVNRYINLLAHELKTTTRQDMRRYEHCPSTPCSLEEPNCFALLKRYCCSYQSSLAAKSVA